jgi:hypothetical protein
MWTGPDYGGRGPWGFGNPKGSFNAEPPLAGRGDPREAEGGPRLQPSITLTINPALNVEVSF